MATSSLVPGFVPPSVVSDSLSSAFRVEVVAFLFPYAREGKRPTRASCNVFDDFTSKKGVFFASRRAACI